MNSGSNSRNINKVDISMKHKKDTASAVTNEKTAAKRSVVFPIILIFVFIITLYFFGICTSGGIQYTTSDYYNALIHKFEVSAPHDEAVAAARRSIFVLRALVAFSTVAAVSSAVGIILCIKTVIKRSRLKKQLEAGN